MSLLNHSRLPQILEQYWGYTSFRPLQREAMEAVIDGRDSLLVLPTGGGKSICFQAPSLARDGLADAPTIATDRVSRRMRCKVSAFGAAQLRASVMVPQPRGMLNSVGQRLGA